METVRVNGKEVPVSQFTGPSGPDLYEAQHASRGRIRDDIARTLTPGNHHKEWSPIRF